MFFCHLSMWSTSHGSTKKCMQMMSTMLADKIQKSYGHFRRGLCKGCMHGCTRIMQGLVMTEVFWISLASAGAQLCKIQYVCSGFSIVTFLFVGRSSSSSSATARFCRRKTVLQLMGVRLEELLRLIGAESVLGITFWRLFMLGL